MGNKLLLLLLLLLLLFIWPVPSLFCFISLPTISNRKWKLKDKFPEVQHQELNVYLQLKNIILVIKWTSLIHRLSYVQADTI